MYYRRKLVLYDYTVLNSTSLREGYLIYASLYLSSASYVSLLSYGIQYIYPCLIYSPSWYGHPLFSSDVHSGLKPVLQTPCN